MIPRYQRIVFWVLTGSILLMAALLLRGCEKAHSRLSAIRDESPIAPPVDTPDETITLALANDADDSILLDQHQIALPQASPVRARALLERLLNDYALPSSQHPLPSGPAVADVFFVDLPLKASVAPEAGAMSEPQAAQEHVGPIEPHRTDALAIVNLRSTFAEKHPSGIEAEDLTIRSIIGTLHANFPQVEQVRFLVDGAARDTLAGHADLSRPYPSTDTVGKPLHVLAADGSPL